MTAHPTSPTDAADLLAAASGLVLWAEEQGLDPDPPGLLDEPTLRRYVLAGMDGYSPGWQAISHRALRRLAEAAGRPTRPAPLRPPGPADPYTPADVDALLTWASGQGNPMHRHAALTVLAAVLGTGLTAANLARIRGTDVTVDRDGAVLVRVPGPDAREAVCHHRYERLLARLAEVAGTDSLLDPGREPTPGRPPGKSIETATSDPRVPALTPQRCRSTWLSHRLADQVPVNVLMAAAGLKHPGVLATRARALGPMPDHGHQTLRRAPQPPDPVAARPGRTRRPGPPPAPSVPSSIASQRIDTRQPRGADPGHLPVARMIARAASPQTAATADQLLLVATRLLAWCDRHGIPADPHHSLDRRTLEHWDEAPDGATAHGEATRVFTRPGLLRAAALLRPDQAPEAPDEPLPYTQAQTDTLLRLAESQADPRVRHAMLAALALGLGAGLRANEVTGLTGTDITRDPATGKVLVNLPDRTVPVLATYEDLAQRVRIAAGTRPVADSTGHPGNRRRLTLLLRGVPRPVGTAALSTPRCRATWIHTHLAHGTRLDVLLTAGDLNPSNLGRALSHLPAVDDATRRRLLRG